MSAAQYSNYRYAMHVLKTAETPMLPPMSGQAVVVFEFLVLHEDRH